MRCLRRGAMRFARSLSQPKTNRVLRDIKKEPPHGGSFFALSTRIQQKEPANAGSFIKRRAQLAFLYQCRAKFRMSELCAAWDASAHGRGAFPLDRACTVRSKNQSTSLSSSLTYSVPVAVLCSACLAYSPPTAADFLIACMVPAPATQPPGQAMPSSR